MNGISGNALGNFAASFFKDFPMRNHGTIPKTGDGMYYLICIILY